MLLPSDKIYISDSIIDTGGRGVFARVDIKKGEIIEHCPVIEIPSHDQEAINTSMLVTYMYYLGTKKNRPQIALGFGSIYNHSYSPNAIYSEKPKENIITFTASKHIYKDQEISVNYNQGATDATAPLWFDSDAEAL